MRGRTGVAVCALLVAALVAIPGSPATAQFADEVVVEDTNFVAAGVGGMRGTGTESITVAGVSGTVTKALLYWNGPTNSPDPAANATVKVNNTPVTGTNIGTASSNCWDPPFDRSQSYRADVPTSLVPGNGTYALSEFRKVTEESTTDINGASLIVFFNDGDASNDRDVTIVGGNDSTFGSTFDSEGWNATISNVAYGGGPANLQLHVSDGQSAADGQVSINGEQLIPQGGNFQGDSVPGTFTGNPEGVSGNLWDVKNYEITQFMTSPATTLNVTSPLGADCISLVAAVVDVPNSADLSIDKADEPDRVTGGGALLYTLTVGNAGPDPATNVVVVDSLPFETAFLSAEGDGWKCFAEPGGEFEGEQVTCTRDSLAPTPSSFIEIVVTTATTTEEIPITNVADVSADQGDPDLEDNHVEETTTVRPQSTPDAASAFCPDSGCTVTTNTGGGATRDDNTFSTLIVPEGANAQTVTITEAAAVAFPGHCGGSTCNGQVVTISNVEGVTVGEPPIRLEMTFDKTVKGGTQIYISKPPQSPVLVANCTTPNVASPHPCVSSKTVLANGDRVIVVLLLSDDPILGKK
jgi:uncharacterized repeat protein (TIGR01451 family)